MIVPNETQLCSYIICYGLFLYSSLPCLYCAFCTYGYMCLTYLCFKYFNDGFSLTSFSLVKCMDHAVQYVTIVRLTSYFIALEIH